MGKEGRTRGDLCWLFALRLLRPCASSRCSSSPLGRTAASSCGTAPSAPASARAFSVVSCHDSRCLSKSLRESR